MINNLNYYQYQRPVAMFSMAKAKAGPLTNLAGFGSGVGESFWENHRQKSQGWANAYAFTRRRKTKKGKIIIERVNRK